MARVPNDIINISVGCSVITYKVMHNKAGIHFVMEEAGQEHCGFVWVDLILRGPVRVGCFDPMEVVVSKHCDGVL